MKFQALFECANGRCIPSSASESHSSTSSLISPHTSTLGRAYSPVRYRIWVNWKHLWNYWREGIQELTCGYINLGVLLDALLQNNQRERDDEQLFLLPIWQQRHATPFLLLNSLVVNLGRWFSKGRGKRKRGENYTRGRSVGGRLGSRLTREGIER